MLNWIFKSVVYLLKDNQKYSLLSNSITSLARHGSNFLWISWIYHQVNLWASAEIHTFFQSSKPVAKKKRFGLKETKFYSLWLSFLNWLFVFRHFPYLELDFSISNTEIKIQPEMNGSTLMRSSLLHFPRFWYGSTSLWRYIK